MQYQVQATDAGTFEIPAVPTGTYNLTAVLQGATRTAAYARVDIRDAAVDDLRLFLTSGVSVSGRIISETVPGVAAIDLSRTSVAVSPAGSGAISVGQVHADGTFIINGVANGEYQIRLANLPEDFYVKAATFGRADAVNSTFAIGTEPTSEKLNITLGTDAGQLTGTVLSRTDAPIVGAQVVLIPDSKRRQRLDQYKVANSDQNGKFSFRGIPPGEYKLFAWEYLDSRAYLNTDVMRTFDDRDLPVQVTTGANGPVAIQVIPLANRN